MRRISIVLSLVASLVPQKAYPGGRPSTPLTRGGLAPAQKPQGRADAAKLAVFVGCGYLLIENHGKTNFTVLLRSDKIQQIHHETLSLWLVDNVLVEAATTDARTIGASRARGRELLQKHMAWETAYTSQQRRWPTLDPSASAIYLGLADVVTMLWTYDAPTKFEVLGQEVTRMMYATAAVDDVVFSIAAPMRAEDDPNVVGGVIRKSMATLRRSANRVDVRDIAAEVKLTPGPWKGCSIGDPQPIPLKR